IAASSAPVLPGHAATSAIEPGCISESTTPTMPSAWPKVPRRQVSPSGETGSAMHAAPFGIEHVVADDLHRPESLPERIGDEGARAVARLAAAHQRKTN